MTRTAPAPAPTPPRRPGLVGIEPLERRTLMAAAAPVDAAFGADGRASVDVAGLADSGAVVRVLPDGKILLAGNASFAVTAGVPPELTQPGSSPQENGRGFLARLNPDGSLDATFGENGIAPQPSDPYTWVTLDRADQYPAIREVSAMVVGPDGTIYLGGASNAYYPLPQPVPVGSAGQVMYFAVDKAFAVAAYNPDGSVRTAYGDHGVAVADMLSTRDRGADEWVRALTVQGDGKVIAAGTVNKEQPDGSDSGSWDQSDIGVVRFNADGSVDPGFGKRVENFPRHAPGLPRMEHANAVAVQPDGKVLVAGYTSAKDGAGAGWALVRYNPDGTRDATFGDDGRLIAAGFAAPDPSDPENNRGYSEPRELLVQPDGKVVVFGNLDLSYFAMMRFTPGGALDASFGDGGRVTARGIDCFDYTVGLRDDGSITVAGAGSGSDWVWIDESRNTMTTRETGHEVYAGTFDSAGRRVSSARAVHVPVVANEDLWHSAVTPDGKIVGIGQMHPAVAHDNPAYPYTADALLVRFDLSQLTVDGPDSRDAGGGAAAPVFSGRATVRAGKANTFRLTFGSEEAARQAQVFVAGPDGSSTAARLVKVKALRGGGGRSRPAIRLTVGATSPAVATYRVAAPGGRYDATDNGTYAVRVAPAGDAAAAATTVGQFSVASRADGGGSAARRATDVLRNHQGHLSA